jgi:hypothetical protein
MKAVRPFETLVNFHRNTTASSPLDICFLLVEYHIFDPEYEDKGFLRNIGELRPDYTASFNLATVSACSLFCSSLLA